MKKKSDFSAYCDANNEKHMHDREIVRVEMNIWLGNKMHRVITKRTKLVNFNFDQTVDLRDFSDDDGVIRKRVGDFTHNSVTWVVRNKVTNGRTRKAPC